MRGDRIVDAIHFMIINLSGKATPASEVYNMAMQAGVARRTLERAKVALSVKSAKVDGKWVWLMDECDGTAHDIVGNISIASKPDLPDVYFMHRKQAELAVTRMHKPHLQEESQEFDIREFKRTFLICGPLKFWGKYDSFLVRVPQVLEENIMLGDTFVFCSASRTQISILQWQCDGFAQYFKRSDYGGFPWPTKKTACAIEISSEDLRLLLEHPKLLLRLSGNPITHLPA
ncbi:MAG: IS66 family insertion sequence element accessory protein TnpB [Defluviitaleaceae bacterium]|nr:IS66 family insertion sequence element accessory protein TnpB [Defluviitaleaceae bacterium]